MTENNYNKAIAMSEKDERDEEEIKSLSSINAMELRELGYNGQATPPTEDQLSSMINWANQYRKSHRKATTREVKRAVRRQFNLIIIPSKKVNED
jgi:hypothetical protein